jgi:hypothetical protein
MVAGGHGSCRWQWWWLRLVFFFSRRTCFLGTDFLCDKFGRYNLRVSCHYQSLKSEETTVKTKYLNLQLLTTANLLKSFMAKAGRLGLKQ